MKSTHPRQIFLATICIFGIANIASMQPITAHNGPTTSESQLPSIRSTRSNSIPNQSMVARDSMRNSRTSSALNAVDRDFATKAAQSDMTEIKTSKLALKRSQNSQVRQYAQEMIQAHTDSTGKLKPIVAQLGLTMPKSLGAANQTLVERLSKLSGESFDRAYISGQTKAHAKTQAIFQKEIDRGRNSELKAFANEVLPVVTSHLQMAQKMTAMR